MTDEDGNPVTKGLVIWHDDPYHGPTVLEAPIDETGHYETLHLLPQPTRKQQRNDYHDENPQTSESTSRRSARSRRRD